MGAGTAARPAGAERLRRPGDGGRRRRTGAPGAGGRTWTGSAPAGSAGTWVELTATGPAGLLALPAPPSPDDWTSTDGGRH
ncbi:MAG TPA: hypothetical protein VGP36_03585 [Mycobacteriales bacterium]|nr:hypothetical protein [Mycobacteriales bacterium]